MNKLGRRKYTQLIADILVDSYGETLKDWGTVVAMAEAVVKKMIRRKYLQVSWDDIKLREYRQWQEDRSYMEF